MVNSRNDRMAEWWNDKKKSEKMELWNSRKCTTILKDRFTGWQNGRKFPEILKDGITENHSKSLQTEWWNITRNPKRRNDGKSPKILSPCQGRSWEVKNETVNYKSSYRIKTNITSKHYKTKCFVGDLLCHTVCLHTEVCCRWLSNLSFTWHTLDVIFWFTVVLFNCLWNRFEGKYLLFDKYSNFASFCLLGFEAIFHLSMAFTIWGIFCHSEIRCFEDFSFFPPFCHFTVLLFSHSNNGPFMILGAISPGILIFSLFHFHCSYIKKVVYNITK